MERKIYNPIQKDSVTFLKRAADTNGEYTLVEVELANGGGVGLHYHKTYSEKFDCLEGEVQVQLDKVIHTLQPGQSAKAAPMINHLFRNRSGKTCRFKVEIRSASRGFEQSLQISPMAWLTPAFAKAMVSPRTALHLPGFSRSVKAICGNGGAFLNSYSGDRLKKQSKRKLTGNSLTSM